jgi:hypothetical protein
MTYLSALSGVKTATESFQNGKALLQNEMFLYWMEENFCL